MSTPGVDRSIDRLALGAAVVDLSELTVERDGEVHPLTPLEADVVRYLWDRSGAVVSRDELLRDVWRYRPGLSTRAVDNTVSRLRAKIEAAPRDAVHLRGVYGQGYVLMGARAATPRATSLPPSPTNIAVDPTSFVGRSAELAALDVRTRGLTTVTGPAGVGKTRLVRTWALADRDRFPGGAWEVALADVSSPDEAAAALIRVLGARPALAVPEAVGALGRVLIVLDSLEHLVDGIAPAIARWVTATPEATWVATSRRPLDLGVERRLAVGPLSFVDAMTLVGDRAEALGVALDSADADLDPALVALIDRLDRLPLALELVARRLGAFTAAQVLARLDLGLVALGEGPRGVPARHASLDRAIAWSWDLLSPEERALLCVCTVFRGGFELEALEEVSADGDAGQRLERLVDHALVRVDAVRGARRFTVYDSVRTFAGLRAPAEDVAVWAERHARVYARWGYALAGEVAVTEDEGRTRALVAETDNFLAAAAWLEGRDAGDFARTAVAVGRAALARGPLVSALALTARALEPPLARDLAERVQLVRAELALASGGDPAELAPLVASEADDVAVLAARLQAIRWVRADQLDVRRLLFDALARAEAAGLEHLVARLLVAISVTTVDDPVATAVRAEQVARRIGYRAVEVRALGLQGHARLEGCDPIGAEEKFRAALDLAGPSERRDALRNLAWAVAMAERIDEADALLSEAAAASRSGGLTFEVAQSELTRLEVLQWAGRLLDPAPVEDLLRGLTGRHARLTLVARALLARILHDGGELAAAHAAFDAVLRDAGADRYQRAEVLADAAAVAWELGDDAAAWTGFDRAARLYAETGSRWDVQVTRMRGAGVLASRDPSQARAAVDAWVGPRPPWVDAARDLVLGLCDPGSRHAVERLRRSASGSPVRWVGPMRRRLATLVGAVP